MAESAHVLDLTTFRGHPFMPYRLKALLIRHGIRQPQLARDVQQRDGRGMSSAAISQLINHQYYPRNLPENEVRARVEAALASYGVPADEIATAWETLDDPEALHHRQPAGAHLGVVARRSNPKPHHDHEEEVEMFLRPEALRPDTRKAFGLFRNPFADEFGSREEVFMWPDFRYCWEALWDVARNGGFRALVSESGAGKTTLVQLLREQVAGGTDRVVLIEPYVVGMEDSDRKGHQLKSAAIADAVIRTLMPHATVRQTPQARFKQAHEALIESAHAGYRHLLLIEEAHSLPIVTLKHLKRWRELRDGMRGLLGIALIGQNELATTLDERNPAVREVTQRCEIVKLLAMDEHLQAYLRARFAAAGKEADEVFAPEAYEAMRQRLWFPPGSANGRSMAYPLAVNNLATRALNSAVARRSSRVDAAIVMAC